MTVADELSDEMARVRDDLLPAYRTGGHDGGIAAAAIERDLDDARHALDANDGAAMTRCLRRLREHTV